MSARLPNPDPDPALRDLLFREAHLRIARQKLAPELTAKEAALRSVKATRSPFHLVMPKRKADFENRLESATAAAEKLRARIGVLERCEKVVARKTEDAIERRLREACPEYVQALAAQRQKEDWLRCLERFGGKIFELTRSLGNVRNLACSGYDRHTFTYSGGAMQAFVVAQVAAAGVEEEVKFANQIADTQLAMFQASGVETRALPRLPETDYVGWVTKISTLPLPEAQSEFDALIAETKQLYETGIAELRAQADQVQQAQENDIHNFLLAAWEQFRTQVAGQVFAGDTERVLGETAALLEAEARLSISGRL